MSVCTNIVKFGSASCISLKLITQEQLGWDYVYAVSVYYTYDKRPVAGSLFDKSHSDTVVQRRMEQL